MEIERGEFVRRLTYYYDPEIYRIVFQEHARPKRLKASLLMPGRPVGDESI